jgi:hypothetical protein
MPAFGFYEWQVQADGTKQPFYITLNDQELFGFAGLWDKSTSADGIVVGDTQRQASDAGNSGQGGSRSLAEWRPRRCIQCHQTVSRHAHGCDAGQHARQYAEEQRCQADRSRVALPNPIQPESACPNCWPAWLNSRPRAALGYYWHGKTAWQVKSGDRAVPHRRKSRFLTLVTGRPR